jgi:formylglycine-generating enzyme required for sulfatase activity
LSNLSNLGITVALVKAGNSQFSDFYIMQTEVTQALWESIMNSNPSMFKGRNKPVENIDLNEIQFFIQRLNTRTGLTFRLPTVQEWIFAASGGESSNSYTYSGGNIIDNIAWYEENARETMPVRQKSRNELGIYDMSGNVWERCQGNMMCGGSWLSPGNLCNVRSSRGVGSAQKDYTIGFRLVVSN